MNSEGLKPEAHQGFASILMLGQARSLLAAETGFSSDFTNIFKSQSNAPTKH